MSPSTIVASASERTQPVPVEAQRVVVVPCRLGLHLRVVAFVVTMARQFESEIQFCSRRLCVDATSILGMLRLGAVRGKPLALVARGPDAARAVQVLAELFESKDVLCKEDVTSEAVPNEHA